MPTDHFQPLTLNIEKLVGDLTEFKHRLELENNLLKTNQLDLLEQSNSIKSDLASAIDTLTQKILSQYPDVFFNQDPSNPFTPYLQKTISKAESLINQCFELNQKNGMIVSALSSINHEFINQLTREPDKVNLYGASGKTQPSDFKKNLGQA
jgi:flagellar biosynthesis/type III secretory pathway chaperone